ncbi:alginate O-acetyltransferase AlgX-related protein [Candidatus Symbiobacter mobilis]|uniref:AlgX/AlgJ SGNH hydrolase-like domain-containing protein n=1 Tax=Candidatus Symbiobacter mobilis CR TaxID=946483 RepID=U5N8L1_9BURK|nr:hypothetical protein [Candidatus Symbiobacter mobilis]AGX86519.1 hypothetical protein Cenrod_0397 [Candidatus Symbiobacter mobilis CR]
MFSFISLSKIFCFLAVVNLFFFSSSVSAEEKAILGKEPWLFYEYDLINESFSPGIQDSIDVIWKFDKILKSNGIQLVFVLVPVKMRIYEKYLPNDLIMKPFMAENYDRILKKLGEQNVAVVDLNTAMLKSSDRDSDMPFFFRMDTHWSPTGVIFSAKTIKEYLANKKEFQDILNSIPSTNYILTQSKRKVHSKIRDLLMMLPQDSPAHRYPLDRYYQVSVSKSAVKEDVMGATSLGSIALVGTSYSQDWTGFSDALRYVLQREVLTVAVNADQGPWVGMLKYLRNDAFHSVPAKILLWEIPERAMIAPPNFLYRAERNRFDNAEWLSRAGAWVQQTCTPSTITTSISPLSLGISAKVAEGISASNTKDADFVEFSFHPALQAKDYINVMLSTTGGNITVEAFEKSKPARRVSLEVANDGAEHVLKTPVAFGQQSVDRVRIYPGASGSFALRQWKVCQQSLP